jgi:cysteine desulfurase
MQSIYLDHAAATPVDPAVFDVMRPYFTDKFYNPSALYLAANDVSKDLLAARTTVAGVLGARPVELTFTAGGTEANNLAIAGVMRFFPGMHAVASAIEHDSVLHAVKQYDHSIAPVDTSGMVDLTALEAAVSDKTVLVSIMYANNEIGTIQPLQRIAALLDVIRQKRKRAGNDLPLYFHTDAAQAANYLDLHVSRLGVDLMTLNGGKIYGPKQSGVLYIHSGVRIRPLVYGGGQEHGLRSGTENVAGIVGFAEALRRTQTLRGDETHRLQELQQYFIRELQQAVPSVIVNGSTKKRLPNNVHLTLPGQDNERLLFALDGQGIQAAAGSACSASNDRPSHVLRAIGLTDAAARSSLRFTMGRRTTRTDIDTTIRVLSGLLAQ